MDDIYVLILKEENTIIGEMAPKPPTGKPEDASHIKDASQKGVKTTITSFKVKWICNGQKGVKTTTQTLDMQQIVQFLQNGIGHISFK